MVACSVCTENGSSAPCRLNFPYTIASRMPNISQSYAGYRVSALCNLPLKQTSTFPVLSCTRESNAHKWILASIDVRAIFGFGVQ